MQVISGKGANIILDIFNGWPDGIQFAKMALPRALKNDTAVIQKRVSKLYSEIFNSCVYSDFGDLSGQKSEILQLVSRLY